MSYLHIENLYKNNDILLFKECYAMEKIHGTSAHILWKDNIVRFSAGGCAHNRFVELFDIDVLKKGFEEIGQPSVIVYGEAYGGKLQKMRETYGEKLRFIAFEVKIGDSWLSIPQAEMITKTLGLEFVYYKQIPATLEVIDAELNADSVQAIRNGCGEGKMREGIVLRPLIELKKNNNERVIAKHKRGDFRETKTPRKLDAESLEILENAEKIADEWVTEVRLTHVLDKYPNADITQTGNVVKSMIEDVLREAEGEIIISKECKRTIGKKTAIMFKERLKQSLRFI